MKMLGYYIIYYIIQTHVHTHKTDPGNLGVGQPQDTLPVRAVDEEAIWLGDGGDVGPQCDIGAVGDWYYICAQLTFPAPLCVRHIHTSTQVLVWYRSKKQNI